MQSKSGTDYGLDCALCSVACLSVCPSVRRPIMNHHVPQHLDAVQWMLVVGMEIMVMHDNKPTGDTVHALLPMNDRHNIDLLLQYYMLCGHVMASVPNECGD